MDRLARFCFRKRWLVVGLWVAAVVILGAASAGGGNFRTEFKLPSSESQRGIELLGKEFSGATGGNFRGTIVFKADDVTADSVKTTMTTMFGKVAKIEGLQVQSPYDATAQGQIVAAGPNADKVAYANVNFADNLSQTDFKSITKDVKKVIPDQAGLQVELGGQVFADFQPPSSELLGVAFAIVILLVAFGSVLAVGLPIGDALAGIFVGIGIVTALSHIIKMPDFTTLLAGMIGLGVGIDYALFIVTRYREGLHKGHSPEDATAIALGTAGRAVVFAGVTVVISLLGMFLMGLQFVRGLAIGASITVAATMLASVTLLPAILGFAKHRIEVTRWRGLVALGFAALALLCFGLKLNPVGGAFMGLAVLTIVAGFFVPVLKKELPPRKVKPIQTTFWYKWSRVIQRRPWPAMLVGLAILVALALPIFSLRLGQSDDGNAPSSSTTRKAYDLLSEGFGPGFNGPLLVVSSVPAGATAETLAPLTKALAGDVGVQFASPQPILNQAGTAAQWIVFPKTSPQDAATTQLVHRLRDSVIPPVASSLQVTPYVTGAVAGGIDFADYLGRRLPIFFGAVLALSFLLLMAVFRSLLVPLKAVIVNLLSIGAAYGVVVAVFQWGWMKDLVGVGEGGPIDAWAPMMMFAIVFGLSMDYEVFLMSRMREEYDRTGDNATAVADGLATTARVITAAAAIMVFVFGSFVLQDTRQIKLFGLGLAVAVFLDATVVRMILVPATMELLGNKNWWLPNWIDRLLPRINVEGGLDEERELVTSGD